MARCFRCGERIPLSYIFKKSMMHTPFTWRRYLHRILGAPFFYCPRFDTEIQPTVKTMLGLLLFTVGLPFGVLSLFIAFGARQHIHILSIAGLFGAGIVPGKLWWARFGKTKEPFESPWER